MAKKMFQRQMANGFVIESVSLSQATVAEALKFKKQLELDIELGYKIIVVDLSNCQSIDNAFMGVLVIVLKQLMRLGGSLHFKTRVIFRFTSKYNWHYRNI